jgi:DNA-binding HxlR family transcriptional regulator
MRVVADDEEFRFSTIAQRLRTITDRALALALRDLSGAALIEREVTDTAPPGSMYRLTRRAQRLARLATVV